MKNNKINKIKSGRRYNTLIALFAVVLGISALTFTARAAGSVGRTAPGKTAEAVVGDYGNLMLTINSKINIVCRDNFTSAQVKANIDPFLMSKAFFSLCLNDLTTIPLSDRYRLNKDYSESNLSYAYGWTFYNSNTFDSYLFKLTQSEIAAIKSIGILSSLVDFEYDFPAGSLFAWNFLLQDYRVLNYNPAVTSSAGPMGFTYEIIESAPLPPDPVKPHYDFLGWYLDEGLTIPYTGQFITADTELYAKFVLKKYTVSFVTNCYLSLGNVQVDALTLLNPVALSRDEANFISWYYDENLTVPYNPAAPVEGNMTLYAKWVVKMVSVRFIVDGEVYADFLFPYGTYLSAAQAYIESIAGVSFNLYADAALKQPFSASSLRDDYTIYGAAGAVARADESANKITAFFEQNLEIILIVGGCIIGILIICVVVAARQKKR